MKRAPLLVFVVVLVLVAAACSDDDEPLRNDAAPPSTTTTLPAATTVPGSEGRVVVTGKATIAGEPLDADFLGAVVRKDGLVTPCQGALPRVEGGAIAIPVLRADESLGCGATGAEVLLWAYVDQARVFSTNAAQWPADGDEITFDPTFDVAKPHGDVGPTTDIAAEAFKADGTKFSDGTKIEAFIGDTLCGHASVRTNGDFTGVSLSVVGPQAIAGCTRGATVHFEVGGRSAATTAVNNFRDVRALEIKLS